MRCKRKPEEEIKTNPIDSEDDVDDLFEFVSWEILLACSVNSVSVWKMLLSISCNVVDFEMFSINHFELCSLDHC